MKRDYLGRAVPATVFFGLLSMGISGCGIFDEGGTPQSARVILEGVGGQAVELVTSNDYAIVSNDDGETREIFLYSADTTSVTSDLNQRYSLGPGVRFYVLASSEVDLPQAVTLKVLIDGEQRFNASSTLGDADLEFVYSFR